MLIFLIIAVPAIALFTWVYLRLAPAETTLKDRSGFESTVLLSLIAAAAAAATVSYTTVGQGTDRAWWPFIAFFYWMFLIPIILLVAGIIRRFLYKTRPQTDT